MMRESFIIHSEYIEDLPEEYKNIFLVYIYNYGIKGITPNLTSLEKSLWIKIQRRIDSDIAAWNETKQARSNAGKKHTGNQYTRKKEMEQMEQCSNSSKSVEQNGTNGTVSVFVSDSVSVNESVSDSVYVNDYEPVDVNVNDNVNVEREFISPKPVLDFNIPQNYAKQVFDILSENQLPCCFNNFITFMQTDFKRALETLHGPELKGFHSDMILGALKNYAQVVNNPKTWQGWKSKKSFDRFVSWDRFWDFLPDRFCLDNFLDRSEVSPPKQQNKGVGLNRALEILEEVQNEKKRVHG